MPPSPSGTGRPSRPFPAGAALGKMLRCQIPRPPAPGPPAAEGTCCPRPPRRLNGRLTSGPSARQPRARLRRTEAPLARAAAVPSGGGGGATRPDRKRGVRSGGRSFSCLPERSGDALAGQGGGGLGGCDAGRDFPDLLRGRPALAPFFLRFMKGGQRLAGVRTEHPEAPGRQAAPSGKGVQMRLSESRFLSLLSFLPPGSSAAPGSPAWREQEALRSPPG